MAKTPSRKPYYITRNTTQLNIELYMNGAVTPNYIIQKNSYESGVAEDLSENISPFVEDFFDHQLPVGPLSGITTYTGQSEVDVIAKVNTVDDPAYEFADGWEVTPNEAIFTDTGFRRMAGKDGYAFFSASTEDGVGKITWTTNTGSTHTDLTSGLADPTKLYQVPVIHPSLTLTPQTSIIRIEGLTLGDDIRFTLVYELNCSKDQTYTIAYINKYGAWDTIDFLGRRTGTSTFTRPVYTSYATGGKRNYNLNGMQEMVLNTGWVDENYYDLVQQLLLSQKVMLIDDVSNTDLIVLNTNLLHRTSRFDKVINYAVTFQYSQPLIPIV